MSKSNLTGEWFLPGFESKYPGRILFKGQKSIQLQIFGQFSIEGEDVTKGLGAYPKHFFDIILGECAFFEKITLYNCHLRKVDLIGQKFGKVVYEADFILKGVHIQKKSELMVESGTFVFPYLSSWYDGWKSVDKLKGGKSGVYFSDDKELQEELNKSKLDIEELSINDNLTLVFWESLDKRIVTLGVQYEVKFQKYLSFKYKKAVNFTELLKDASIFAKLLSFSISEPLYYNILSLGMPDEILSAQKSFLKEYTYAEVPVSTFVFSNGRKVDHHSLHQNFQIISNWTFQKEELNKIIVTWFSNTFLFHVYDYYNDSNNWFQGSEVMLSNVMFNNRFLNIIQGLEDYYRKTVAAEQPDAIEFNLKKQQVLELIEDPGLNEWLKKKLKAPKSLGLAAQLSALLKKFYEVVDELFTNKEIIQLFPKHATTRRHQLSHGNLRTTSQGVALELYFYFGRVLLAICILHSLDITGIAKRIGACQRLYDKIRLINSIKLVVKKDI